jgi:hypothetical protein
VAFQGAVADVLAFHSRQRGQHGEHDAGRVVRALKLAGEELKADAGGAQLLGERGELLRLVREAADQVSVSAGPGGSRVVAVFTMPAAAASSAAGP